MLIFSYYGKNLTLLFDFDNKQHVCYPHQVTTVMKMLLGFSLCLVLHLLSCLSGPVESRTLHVDSCSVNVHIHELRKYYSEIRSNAISGDDDIGVKLLDRSLIKDVEAGQTCCFLRLLLRFYVERVFSNYPTSHRQQQRCYSALANAFVSIRRDMHQCHCHCEEETHRRIDSLHTEFDKLQIPQAAKKAVGELDTILDWLEGLRQTAQI
ncbi:interleukin 19 like [Cololabis saira]|uniref:interleukin 19 like n=1 Tax=Cololabis saira TaxID=129043 RepID=UPI002AD53425|nr:interleukin 19 like [Cololabis saira]